MKKLMLILVSVLMLGITSCSKDEDPINNVKQTWVFTITTTQTVVPAMEGYPMIQTMTVEQNNLTESEAKVIANYYKSTITQTFMNHTYTITTTATYAVKQ